MTLTSLLYVLLAIWFITIFPCAIFFGRLLREIDIERDNHIGLEVAHWCENCESVIDNPGPCTGCGTSVGLIPLTVLIETKRDF